MPERQSRSDGSAPRVAAAYASSSAGGPTCLGRHPVVRDSRRIPNDAAHKVTVERPQRSLREHDRLAAESKYQQFTKPDCQPVTHRDPISMLTARLVSIVRRATPQAPSSPVSSVDKDFAKRAVAKLSDIISNPAFFDEVVSAPYSTTLWLAPDNSELTPDPQGVVDIIKSGVEGGYPNRDETLNLSVALVNLWSGIQGSTLPRAREIRIDTDFFADCQRRSDLGSLAAVLMHEWMHTAGFIHPLLGDDHDAPSIVHRIVERLATLPTTRPDS